MKQTNHLKRKAIYTRFEKFVFFAASLYGLLFFGLPFFVFLPSSGVSGLAQRGNILFCIFDDSISSWSFNSFESAFRPLRQPGLLSLAKRNYYFLIESIVLLPCLIPPLLLVLSVVHLTEKISPFPFGLTALIVVQTLTYSGLCAVAFTRILLKEVSCLSEWAYLQGISSWLFLKALAQTILLKDIKTLFVLVFAGSFTSLSLPLLAGGNPFFSLEFFIYENLKDPQLWPQALGLILFQSLFIFLICWKAFSGSSASDLKLVSFKTIYLLPFLFFMYSFLELYFAP